MRLHHLRIEAFGPFAEPVDVDFDELSSASVFLLCGATGAGKTTVLDAVTFAFYGDVPGDRGAAKQLKSHHSADDTVPRVVLEATVADRRLRIARTPIWMRPKKRGTGLTQAQASILVEERVGDEWVLRTNRLDEAGNLIGDLLGMTRGQFEQVALLPQGQFDTFLRSGADDRQRVLARLFRTSRFEDVERWLVDRRTTLRRAGERHSHAVSAMLHRISEAAGRPLPDGWTDDLADEVTDGTVAAWADQVIAHVTAAAGAATAEAEAAATAHATAAEAHRTAVEQTESRHRHAQALQMRDRLDEAATTIASSRNRCAAAIRARPVAPLAGYATLRIREAAAATEAARVALNRAADELGKAPKLDNLGHAVDEARDRVGALESVLPKVTRLAALTEQRASEDAAIETLRATVAEHSEAVAELEGRRIRLGSEATELGQSRDRLAAAKTVVVESGKVLTQHAVAAELSWQIENAREAENVQLEATHALRDELRHLVERRLSGMAAELAAGMAVGADCPVCGSPDHPHPARPAQDAPTKEDEAELRRRIDSAEVVLESLRDKTRGYAARLAVVRDGLGGDDEATVAARIATAQADVQVLTTQVARADVIATELASLAGALETTSASLAAATTDLAVAEERRTSTRAAAAALTDEVAEVLSPDLDPAEALRIQQNAHDRLAELHEALVVQQRADEEAARAKEAAREAASGAGFETVAAAVAALIGPDELATLEASIADHETESERVSAVLEDPAVIAAAAAEPRDPARAATALADADRHRTAAAATAEATQARLTRLNSLRAGLDTALTDWTPVLADFAVARRLAGLVEGKSPDNRLQMRLSAFVLANRLDQVIAAANERLVSMTDDRYRIEHTSDRGVGDRRGGLGLLILDQWTDERRDPVTLSGGETFMVSLALALGLADVVSIEAGGTDVDTLFVDEGFGSLDSDSLELVMDTLDGLRAGGRVVGVVSHVGELRSRIPMQLEVIKGRRGGSTVRQRTVSA